MKKRVVGNAFGGTQFQTHFRGNVLTANIHFWKMFFFPNKNLEKVEGLGTAFGGTKFKGILDVMFKQQIFIIFIVVYFFHNGLLKNAIFSPKKFGKNV